eukprot:82242-Pelagomonas_calceolata.AAC.6
MLHALLWLLKVYGILAKMYAYQVWGIEHLREGNEFKSQLQERHLCSLRRFLVAESSQSLKCGVVTCMHLSGVLLFDALLFNLLFHLPLEFGSVSVIPGFLPGVLVPDATLTWCKLVKTLPFPLCVLQPSQHCSAARPARAARLGKY